MSKCIAIYARVSSEKQAQSGTILSQIDALEKRVLADGHHLLDEHRLALLGLLWVPQYNLL